MQKMPPGSTLPYSLWESLSLGFVMGCRYVYTCMHKQSNCVMGLGRPFFFHMAFDQGNICVTWTHWVTIPQLQPTVQLSWASWDFITFFKGTLTLVERHEGISCSTFPASLKIETSSNPFCGTFLQTAGSCSVFGFTLKCNLCFQVLTLLCVCVTDDE